MSDSEKQKKKRGGEDSDEEEKKMALKECYLSYYHIKRKISEPIIIFPTPE